MAYFSVSIFFSAMNVTHANGNISENERDESFLSTTVFIYIVNLNKVVESILSSLYFQILG